MIKTHVVSIQTNHRVLKRKEPHKLMELLELKHLKQIMKYGNTSESPSIGKLIFSVLCNFYFSIYNRCAAKNSD